MVEELLDLLCERVDAPAARPARASAYARMLRSAAARKRRSAGGREPRARHIVQHDVEVVVVGG